MGEPALQLSPIEDAVAEQAAKQTSRLVVIQGGKRAAVEAGEATVAEATGEGILAGAGIAMAALGAFFLVLLLPSSIADEPSMARAPRTQPVPQPNPVPLTQPCPKEEEKRKEKKPKRYTVAIHAQGKDCGGRTSSTIGAPAMTLPVPVPVAVGLHLSAATQALLNKSQLKVRRHVILEAEKYITTGPAEGGRLGPKSFVVLGVRGGIRFDVDCWGDGPSFLT